VLFGRSISCIVALKAVSACNIDCWWGGSFLTVVVVCANRSTVREILLAAEELNMVASGEYVFFNIELFSRWVPHVILLCRPKRKSTKTLRNLLRTLTNLYGRHCCSYCEESKHARVQNRYFRWCASYKWGTAVAQWLRCCATNRKVAGSIPAGVSGFFIDIILPIALWPWVDSASNRNEYQEYFLG